MKKNSNKINARLYALGKKVGLEVDEIYKAKRTIKNLVCLLIAAGILFFIGLFMVNRMDHYLGLWYMPPSIKDFSFFRGLF